MSTSIPDSVSMSDLESLAKTAATPKQEALYDGLTEDQLNDVAVRILTSMTKACGDPMLEKTILLRILGSWIEFHSTFAEMGINEKDSEMAINTACDAGKAKAAFQIIMGIGFKNDFIIGND